jgi:hypothetical protein
VVETGVGAGVGESLASVGSGVGGEVVDGGVGREQQLTFVGAPSAGESQTKDSVQGADPSGQALLSRNVQVPPNGIMDPSLQGVLIKQPGRFTERALVGTTFHVEFVSGPRYLRTKPMEASYFLQNLTRNWWYPEFNVLMVSGL